MTRFNRGIEKINIIITEAHKKEDRKMETGEIERAVEMAEEVISKIKEQTSTGLRQRGHA